MNRGTLIIIISLAMLKVVYGQKDSMANIADKVNEIAISQGLNITELEKGGEEAKKLLKNKCEKNGGADAYDKIFVAKDNLTACLQDLVNSTVLQEEMRQAGPNGDVDLVFKKYCDKKPKFQKCITNFMSTLEPCLEQQEKDNVKTIINVTDSLYDFICFKEGDRIALFVSVGGPECFMDKRESIQNCLNSTFGGQLPIPVPGATSPNFDSLPVISFGINECTHMQDLQTCVVKKLEECKDTTIGNMADSLFKFIRNATPCDGVMKARSAKAEAQSGAGTSTNSFALLLLIIASLGFKLF